MQRDDLAVTAPFPAGEAIADTGSSPGANNASRHARGWLQRPLLNALRRVRHGRIELALPDRLITCGSEPDDHDLTVRVDVRHPRLFADLLWGGSLGGAEAYLRGDWTTDDLTSLLRILCRNFDLLSEMDRGLVRFGLSLARLAHRWASNTRRGSRRNIAAHYDLGNDFFELFLDPTLMYSSAYFEQDGQALEAASEAKLERICRTLNLTSSDHVLEIGTGWGGFALHAARHYGCHITTTTISQNQYERTAERIIASGLNDRITLLKHDYRDLTGRYDKVVSIEMVEAVGHTNLPVYFNACDRLLQPGGRLLIQAITMPDQRYERYRRSVDFIQKYIFPGGHLPSIGAMQQAVAESTSLVFVEGLQFPDSYARTLREWRVRFHQRIDDVRRLGFDDRFLRMWEYYLCYCEAAFMERAVSVGQFVWEKSRY